MTPEQQVLDEIRRALAAADVDADALVAEAFADARAEVVDTLRRLIARDLLDRALRSLGPDGGRRGPAPEPGAAGPPTPEPGAAGPPTPPASAAAEAPDAGEARAEPAGERALYVLGVTGADALLDLDGLDPPPGGGPFRRLTQGALQALVCDVDPATFEVLRTPGPEGLDTLAAAARAHDSALAALAARTTVLPLPLGTVLADEATLARLLAAHAARLHAELDRLAGCSEWAVTVRDLDVEGTGEEQDSSAASSGGDYLRRRSAALNRRAEQRQRREELATRIHQRLARGAREADTVASRPVEDVAPPLLHGVYLLDAAEVDELETRVGQLRREHPGAVIELTGPWPPYHFSSVELTVDRQERP